MDKQFERTPQRGFTILELIFSIGVLVALGAIVMPRMYDDRFADNERNAQDVLRMIHSAQLSWQDATGEWAELYRLQFAPGREPNELEPFLPFLEASADNVYYGGYHFFELRDQAGNQLGCRAEPITPEFSGVRIFELAYSVGEVREVPLAENS